MSIFKETLINNTNIEVNEKFYIKLAGITYPDSTYLISRDNSSTIVFGYVCEGIGYLKSNGKVLPLYQGDTFIEPSKTSTKLYSDEVEPFKFKWITAQGTLLEFLLDYYFDREMPIIATRDTEKIFDDIIANICLEPTLKTEYEQTLLLHSLFMHIKNSLNNYDTAGEINVFSLENQMENYIIGHIQNKFNLDDICQNFYMSTSQLIKLFKAKYKCTPYNYYLNVKIELSKKMLADTNLSIDDIAERLNFNDRNHYTKAFLKKTTLTPYGFRKSLK